jgi:hypothetical protein
MQTHTHTHSSSFAPQLSRYMGACMGFPASVVVHTLTRSHTHSAGEGVSQAEALALMMHNLNAMASRDPQPLFNPSREYVYQVSMVRACIHQPGEQWVRTFIRRARMCVSDE